MKPFTKQELQAMDIAQAHANHLNKARHALDRFSGYQGYDTRTYYVELISDLMHLADLHSMDANEICSSAMQRFNDDPILDNT